MGAERMPQCELYSEEMIFERSLKILGTLCAIHRKPKWI